MNFSRQQRGAAGAAAGGRLDLYGLGARARALFFLIFRAEAFSRAAGVLSILRRRMFMGVVIAIFFSVAEYLRILGIHQFIARVRH